MMSIMEFLTGNPGAKAELEQLRVSLEAQQNRFAFERKEFEDRMKMYKKESEALRAELDKTAKEKAALEKEYAAVSAAADQLAQAKSLTAALSQENAQIKAADAALARENHSLKSEMDQLSNQARNYHSLAESNWLLYEKAEVEAKHYRQILDKIASCMNEMHTQTIRFEVSDAPLDDRLIR